ncbi:hypothetical protein EP56_08120 [Listeriaceae bacterium FSL A5-0209]|nr:hypothetical protein EP56_08120 [Listeriaceae bacterium FSL A5-0209]
MKQERVETMPNNPLIGEELSNFYGMYLEMSKADETKPADIISISRYLCRTNKVKIKLLPLKQGMIFDSL